jgi:hypothetical protein
MEGRHSSAPPPSTFPTSWSPSRTVALDPANLILTKRDPRPWERAPHQPTSQESRFRIVWKRYELRSRPSGQVPPLHSTPILDDTALARGRAKTPERAIKKMRVSAGALMSMKEDVVSLADEGLNGFVATKWQKRRSSSLPSTSPSLIDMLLMHITSLWLLTNVV